MSTPPAGDEPSTLDQAKDDAKSIAAGAAKGAALGGLAGAVRGAGIALVKSKTGRNLAVTAITVPVLTFSLIAGAASLVPAGGATTAMSVGYEANALAAAEKDAADPKTLRTIQDAAIRTGVRWEVLSAIWQTQKARTSDKGVGPFGIDLEKAGDGISKEDAGDLEKAAVYVGRQLASNENGTVRNLPNRSLDAGAIDVRSNDGGDFTRKISPAADMQRAQEDVKTQYLAALSGLPLKGMPDNAQTVYTTAHSWAMGLTQKCTVGQGDVTLGGQTSVDLNEQQLKYAQIIINRVAARKMSQKAAVVALSTALQESTLRMWWNVKVPGSEALTDDKAAKGSDGYSVGLFQQQVNGNMFSWGTVNDAMDPNRSTEMFLDRLETIPHWEEMEVSRAAQAVQASAFPDAYAKWESQATQLVNDLKPTGGGGYKDDHEDSHSEAPSSGSNSSLKVNTETHTNTQAVEAAMIDKFSSGISAMYDTSGTQDHTVGRAVDLMIKDYKGAGGIAFGDSITTFLIKNADAFGIDYLIWRDKIWLGASTGWKDYSGGGYGGMYSGNWNDTTLHMDHVHVSVKDAPGTGGDYVYTPGQASGANASCAAGGVHGIGVGSAGENDDYPYRDPAGDCAWCAGSADPGADPWSLYKRECVSFVAWRMNQQMGWKEGSEYPFTPGKLGIGLFGNAAEWKGNLAKAGYVTDKTPKAGAIAWWGAYGATGIGEAGHVAVVKKVNPDGTIDIEQYNAWPKEHAYSTQTIPAASVNGFIHVADTEK